VRHDVVHLSGDPVALGSHRGLGETLTVLFGEALTVTGAPVA